MKAELLSRLPFLEGGSAADEGASLALRQHALAAATDPAVRREEQRLEHDRDQLMHLRFAHAAVAPLLAWMSFLLFATGEFSMGRSSHDLGNNLYYRMQRMGTTLPEAERPPVKAQGHTKASVGEYLHFVLAHPGAAAAQNTIPKKY